MAKNYKRKSDEEKEKEVNDLLEKAEKGIESVFDSQEDIKSLGDYISKFYNYSIRNTLLIQKQFQGALAVGSYAFWKAKGFLVNKGEKGIKILAPNKRSDYFINEDGERVSLKKATEKEKELIKTGELEVISGKLSFSQGYIFDVSQTNAKADDLPKIFPNRWLEGDVENYDLMYKAMENIAKSIGVKIIDPPYELGTSKGASYPLTKEIALNPRNDQLQNVKTLIHELAHAKLHTIDKQDEYTKNAKEFQAELTAYTVCKYFGLDTEEYSFRYISEWIKDVELKDKEKLLNEVKETVHQYIEVIEETLENEKELSLEKEKDINLEENMNKGSDKNLYEMKEEEFISNKKDLQKIYNEWRKNIEIQGVPFKWLGDEKNIKAFSEFANLDKPVDFEQMIDLESNLDSGLDDIKEFEVGKKYKTTENYNLEDGSFIKKGTEFYVISKEQYTYNIEFENNKECYFENTSRKYYIDELDLETIANSELPIEEGKEINSNEAENNLKSDIDLYSVKEEEKLREDIESRERKNFSNILSGIKDKVISSLNNIFKNDRDKENLEKSIKEVESIVNEEITNNELEIENEKEAIRYNTIIDSNIKKERLLSMNKEDLIQLCENGLSEDHKLYLEQRGIDISFIVDEFIKNLDGENIDNNKDFSDYSLEKNNNRMIFNLTYKEALYYTYELQNEILEKESLGDKEYIKRKGEYNVLKTHIPYYVGAYESYKEIDKDKFYTISSNNKIYIDEIDVGDKFKIEGYSKGGYILNLPNKEIKYIAQFDDLRESSKELSEYTDTILNNIKYVNEKVVNVQDLEDFKLKSMMKSLNQLKELDYKNFKMAFIFKETGIDDLEFLNRIYKTLENNNLGFTNDYLVKDYIDLNNNVKDIEYIDEIDFKSSEVAYIEFENMKEALEVLIGEDEINYKKAMIGIDKGIENYVILDDIYNDLKDNNLNLISNQIEEIENYYVNQITSEYSMENTELEKRYDKKKLEFLEDYYKDIDLKDRVIKALSTNDKFMELTMQNGYLKDIINNLEYDINNNIQKENKSIDDLKNELNFYNDLSSCLSQDINLCCGFKIEKENRIVNQYETKEDIKLEDGTFINKGTAFFIQSYGEEKFEVHFEGREDNIYANGKLGSEYYFNENEIKNFTDLNNISSLYGKRKEEIEKEIVKNEEKERFDMKNHRDRTVEVLYSELPGFKRGEKLTIKKTIEKFKEEVEYGAEDKAVEFKFSLNENIKYNEEFIIDKGSSVDLLENIKEKVEDNYALKELMTDYLKNNDLEFMNKSIEKKIEKEKEMELE